MRSSRILIVDDEPGIRQSLSGVLEDEGFQVEAVENGEACLDILARSIFELVILDIWMPGIDGLEGGGVFTGGRQAAAFVIWFQNV